jgi:hypothetical protein
VPSDLGGHGFESLAEEIDFDDDVTEGVGLSITPSMSFHESSEFEAPVKDGFGNSCMRGDGNEGDSFASFDQLSAGRLDPFDQVSAHANCASELSRSMRSINVGAGDFFALAAGLGVGHQCLGVDPLGKQRRQEWHFGFQRGLMVSRSVLGLRRVTLWSDSSGKLVNPKAARCARSIKSLAASVGPLLT